MACMHTLCMHTHMHPCMHAGWRCCYHAYRCWCFLCLQDDGGGGGGGWNWERTARNLLPNVVFLGMYFLVTSYGGDGWNGGFFGGEQTLLNWQRPDALCFWHSNLHVQRLQLPTAHAHYSAAVCSCPSGATCVSAVGWVVCGGVSTPTASDADPVLGLVCL